MIDWEQIRQLEEDMGAEDLGDIVEVFLSEVEAALSDVARNPPTEPEDMAARMHFLKGSAYNLGFEAFGSYCAKAEEAAHAGNTSEVSVTKARRLYSESKEIFLREFSRYSSAELALVPQV